VGGRAVYENIAEFPFGAGPDIEVEEKHRSGRHGTGTLNSEFDAERIIGEFEAAQFGLVGFEQNCEIGAAAPRDAEAGKRNAVEPKVAKRVGKGGRETRKADDIAEILEVRLAGDVGGDRFAGGAAERREAARIHGLCGQNVNEAVEIVALDAQEGGVTGLADKVVNCITRGGDHKGARVLAQELVGGQI
jgi:hypothetical protein